MRIAGALPARCVQSVRTAAPPLAAVLLLIAPLLVPNAYWLSMLQLAGIYIVLAVGLNLVTGYAGQPSMGHGALCAVGAYTSALLTVSLGWPFWLAFLAAPVAAGLFGLLLGVPSLRLSDAYLAMVTVGFAIIVERSLVNLSSITQGALGIGDIPPPYLFGYALKGAPYYYLVLLTVALLAWIARNIVRSRFGRAFAAVRNSELAASCNGVNLFGIKLQAFVISAVYAGVAGSLYAHLYRYISPDTFSLDLGIFLLLIVIIGGMGTLAGPIIGGAVLTLLPEILQPLQSYRLIIYGSLLILALNVMPEGIVGLLQRRSARASVPRPGPGGEARAVPVLEQVHAAVVRTHAPVLQVSGLGISFGGLAALRDLDLEVRQGTIHTVIGPNGSGKSTFLNLVSAIYPSSAGRICFHGRDITDFSPHRVAAVGIARTFQTPQVFAELSVLDNVLVGAHAWQRTRLLSAALRSPSARAEEREVTQWAQALAEYVGLHDKLHTPAGKLAHHEHRFLELARALAGRPSLLLLDEPAAGLGAEEMAKLGRYIEELKRTGLTIVLVEHHMELVMGISDHVTVLDSGRKIAEGPPAQVQADPTVIAAYLGEGEVALVAA